MILALLSPSSWPAFQGNAVVRELQAHRAADDGTDHSTMTMSTTSRSSTDDPEPVAGGVEHLGCFMDSKNDRVLGHKLKSPEMTPQASRIAKKREKLAESPL